MSRIDDLTDQAKRAERLANAINDALSIERLRDFAQECRRQADQLTVEPCAPAAA
jgi:hypothetical protein